MGRLDEHRWTELDQPLIMVPLGSCEQHGPHLPIGTDTTIACAIADRAASALDALVAPPIGIGASGEHAGYPGTLSIGTAALADVLIEVIRSADWSAGVVVVNAHGGNTEAIRSAVSQSIADGRTRLLAWSPPRPAGYPGDLHAGFIETSVIEYLHPDLVARDRIAPGTTAAISTLRERGVAAISPTGVLGDPTGANPDDGETILGAWVDNLIAGVASARRRWDGADR